MAGPYLYPQTLLDANQVLQFAFDDATQSLRVQAVATIVTPPAIDVVISHANDSIRIGDGTTLVTLTGTALDVNVTNSGLNDPTTFNVVNVNATTAGTEYSYTFPANTKNWILKARGLSSIKLSSSSGGAYQTLSAGSVYKASKVDFSGTIYFIASKNAETIEISYWD